MIYEWSNRGVMMSRKFLTTDKQIMQFFSNLVLISASFYYFANPSELESPHAQLKPEYSGSGSDTKQRVQVSFYLKIVIFLWSFLFLWTETVLIATSSHLATLFPESWHRHPIRAVTYCIACADHTKPSVILFLWNNYFKNLLINITNFLKNIIRIHFDGAYICDFDAIQVTV